MLILFSSVCTLFVLAQDTVVSRISVLFISVTLLLLNFIVYYLYNVMIDKYVSEKNSNPYSRALCKHGMPAYYLSTEDEQ